MGDIHVLDGKGSEYAVAMHFTVPSGNNPEGVPWSTALLRSGRGGTTVLEDGDGTQGTIDTATEKLAIEAGTVFEKVVNVELDGSGQTTSGRLTVLQDRHAFTLGALTAELQSSLRYFGQVEGA